MDNNLENLLLCEIYIFVDFERHNILVENCIKCSLTSRINTYCYQNYLSTSLNSYAKESVSLFHIWKNILHLNMCSPIYVSLAYILRLLRLKEQYQILSLTNEMRKLTTKIG